jgi:hypothetical protein
MPQSSTKSRRFRAAVVFYYFCTKSAMKNTVLTGTQKLQARLNAAGAMTISVFWEDQKATLTSRGGTVVDITGTSYTDIVPAPGATVIRTITAFNIINTGSNNTVFVGLFNGTATKEFFGALLNTRWRIDEDGVKDSNGVLQFVGAAGAAPVLTATSSTSNTLSVGNGKSFTVPNAVRPLSVGQRIIAAVTGQATTRYMLGRLATFNNTNITIDVQNAADVVGTGTSTTWSLGLAADVAGLNGTNFLQGSGVPPALVGAESDSYLDVANGNVYNKSGGVWTLTGNLKGADGSSFRSGAGVPSNGLGNNGDTYLNTSNGDTYAKSGGTWTLNGNIKGVQGFNFYSGAGVPSNGLGNNGDSYLNTTNGDTYGKSAGTWTVNGNIKGTPGGAETVNPITGLPIDWATGKIQRLPMSADLAPTPGQFQNPQSGFAHVIILTNASGAPRTFTLPTDTAHFTPATRGVTVANNRRRTLSAIYDGTSYHWAVGEELQNN